MSKVDELIQELCPDGVQRVALSEVAQRQKGMPITATKMKELAETPGMLRIYAGGQTQVDVDPRLIEEKYIINEPSVIVRSRGYIDFARSNGPFTHKNEMWSYSVKDVRANISFIYYYLLTQRPALQLHAQATSVKLPQLSVADTDNLQIPLPPLEVQEEIVRILDQFVELDRELEQEVGGRELQKTALSNALFDQMSAYPLVPLQSIGTWFGGGTPSKKNDSFWKNGVIPWVSPKDMQGHSVTSTVDYITEEAVAGSSAKLVPAGSTALVTRSSILDKRLPVAYFPQTVAMNQDLKAVCPQDGVNGRYLFNALEHSRESILLQAHKKGGSVASLDTKRLMLFEVPLPPLEVQEEIANKLDTFTEYIDSLKRERELRQKQYEYYRDLLLDFPVKE